jgi:putative membrane protein insertion efficiency factor
MTTSDPAAPAAPEPEPSVAGRVLLAGIRVYQRARSGRPTGCRFVPSCSVYAEEAILVHGARHGSRLALARLARCRPWGGQGVDLVPERSTSCTH